ncbi:MAG TPA: DNA polymerase I [Gemmatimonadota bacterium]|nr:DNA polymerase I [Gemmatimonadota bacterium]
MTRPTLYLIDGYALIYRSFFAFARNPLRTSAGEETGAAYGMANFLVKLLDERKPDHLGVVLDSREPTFRHQQFPDYKATREKMPDDLRAQLARVQEVFEAFRVPMIEVPHEEADDVIGTLATKAAAQGLDVYIVSGDKDFYQLIDEHVMLFNPGRGGLAAVEEEVIDLSNAAAKFGVEPVRVPDILGLMGDSSDNIPGIPGIGAKTARKLVEEWGSVEAIYEHIDQAGSPKLRERLTTYREAALLSKDLVTIRTDLDLDLDLETLATREPDREKATALFAELEFVKLLQRFGGREEALDAEAHYAVVDTPEALHTLVSRLEKAEMFAIDVEASSLDPLTAEIIGLAFATDPGRAWYVPVGHTSGRNLSLATALAGLKPLLEDPERPKVGQNVKYDLLVLERAGVALRGVVADTMLAAYLLDPARRAYGLDLLALELLGHKMLTYDEVTRPEGRKDPLPFADVEIEAAARYACEDADVTLRLAQRFLPELDEKGLLDLYREVELPLVPVLAAIERSGIALDREFFAAMSERLAGDLGTIERECMILAGEPFNLNSPQQLSVVLFEKLKLPVVRRTKTGYSTDAEVLEALALQHDLPRRLLEYRELAKLKSTYVDALPAALHRETGRLHSSFNQTVASSGRLSSSDPNLQNVPIRTPLGREIRRGFVPSEPGWLLLVSDYSQIELRILAHLSRDANLVEAFRSGHDIHRQTAALVFGLEPEEVSPALRTRAKEVNFGIIYGMGAFGLARRLGIAREEAEAFIEGYFARFRDVRRFQEETIARAREQGYVTTLLGRRRYLPEIHSRNYNIRAFAERVAINSPIQGTAADLIKIAMIRIHARLAGDGIPARMLLTVHDELVFEVHEESAEALGSLVRKEMEGAIALDVPVVVGIGTGRTWYDAK